MSKPGGKRFMDALDALSSGSGSSLSGSDTEGGEDGGAGRGPGSLAPEQPGGAAAAAGAGSKKKARVEITVDDLTRAGYSGGPSVLFMKAPDEGGQTDWAWSNGKDAKQRGDVQETAEERAATREAATVGVEESVRLAARAAEHAERLRQAARQERDEIKRKNAPETVNQKEKRKRDAGQASRGKNYVEEEKRAARSLGVYSGFD